MTSLQNFKQQSVWYSWSETHRRQKTLFIETNFYTLQCVYKITYQFSFWRVSECKSVSDLIYTIKCTEVGISNKCYCIWCMVCMTSRKKWQIRESYTLSAMATEYIQMIPNQMKQQFLQVLLLHSIMKKANTLMNTEYMNECVIKTTEIFCLKNSSFSIASVFLQTL